MDFEYDHDLTCLFPPTLVDENPVLTDEILASSTMRCLPGQNPDETNSSLPTLRQWFLHNRSEAIKNTWPDLTDEVKENFSQFYALYTAVKAHNLPNFLGARITLCSDLNIVAWRKRLAHYHDKILCEFLEFGWPVGYQASSPPESTNNNHPSALNWIDHVKAFIDKELEYQAVIGPFTQEPFHPWTRVSPIMSRPKRESKERRIIIDLSYPNGTAVNDGIDITNHMGVNITYSLPTITDLVERVKSQGEGAFLWKTDLSRAYRQIRVDPLDTPLLAMRVDDGIFLDLCPPFGCRSSAAICQRMANALVYLLRNEGMYVLAYLDDFGGCNASKDAASKEYDTFRDIAKDLGLALAEKKSCPPSQRMEWLGYLVDTTDMTVSIPKDKLDTVLNECQEWLKRHRANKTTIQAIAGRLIYIASCIPQARKFTARVLATLRAMGQRTWTTINQEFKADILWFTEYARSANGIHLLTQHRPTFEIECDSSLFAGGAADHQRYYTWTYSVEHRANFPAIHHLEAINLVVAYKTLAPRYATAPANIIISTDNMANSFALETGRTKDPTLAACARELWLSAAIHNHSIRIRHKMGTEIPLADALSRLPHSAAKKRIVAAIINQLGIHEVPPLLNDYVFFNPSL